MAATVNTQQTSIGNSATVLYTGSAAGSVVTRIDLANTSGGTVAVTTLTIAGQVYLTNKALVPLGTVGIPDGADQPAAGRYSLDFGQAGVLLKSGQTISATGSAAGAIGALVCAIDLT